MAAPRLKTEIRLINSALTLNYISQNSMVLFSFQVGSVILLFKIIYNTQISNTQKWLNLELKCVSGVLYSLSDGLTIGMRQIKELAVQSRFSAVCEETTLKDRSKK